MSYTNSCETIWDEPGVAGKLVKKKMRRRKKKKKKKKRKVIKIR